MNRSALKTYAPKARLDFIRAVTDRAAFFGLTPDRTEAMQETGDVVLIGGRAFPRVVAEQRKKLQERISQHGFDQVMEAMAYTWFNRFVALRYMELHGYLEHGYRVLSQAEGKTTPEILEHAEHVTLPGLDAQQVINLKLDGSREAELYRLLLVAQCNALHEAMPFLFEKIADETELLLPDNLLHSDSLIRKLVNEIDEADWQQVEILGWLYQFYISDKKDEVIGSVVKSEDIPAATQLFTPNWIVKYLVQNTLGRQWLATYPDSPLRQQMQYYIEPAEQSAEVKAQLAAITPKSLDPETLTLLDPASGSGHILVEAYDLFKAIYQERGYRSKDIPRLILQKNLFGLEIDDRAAQLAAFALLMKARADDRRIFAEHIQPNVIAIQESKGLENLLRPDPAAAKGAGELPFADSNLFPQTEKQLTLAKPNQESPLAAVEPCLRELIKLFEHGKTFGSLIRVPPGLAEQLPSAQKSIEAMGGQGQLWEHRAATLLLPLVSQAAVLAGQFDAVVANPPYMGGKSGMNPLLKAFAQEAFPNSKSDLYAMFMERAFSWLKPTASNGMVTMESWMFLPSYERLRTELLAESTLTCLEHMPYEGRGRTSMGISFGTAAFVLRRPHLPNFSAHFGCIRYTEIDDAGIPKEFPVRNERLGYRCVDKIRSLPGQPIAYWLSDAAINSFSAYPQVGTLATVRAGLQTGDNDLFLRFWHEVSFLKVGLSLSSRTAARDSHKKWFPHNKGGDYRKWYGNGIYLINWLNDGEEIKAKKAADLASGKITANNSKCWNQEHYFRSGFSWSSLTSGSISFRANGPGYLFDTKGQTLFPNDSAEELPIIAFLNSTVAGAFLSALAPTMDFNGGTIAKLPVLIDTPERAAISQRAAECIRICKEDWDSREESWDFAGSPLLSRNFGRKVNLACSFEQWKSQTESARSRLRLLETENNTAFVRQYGLDGVVVAELAEDEITIAPLDRERDIKRLVSYAVGCTMGRYSFDKSGLVYAHSRNEGFDPSQYRTFPADPDGIVPLTELAWFPDDASERFVEFIGKAWPTEHLEENLKFIADSLGPNREEHPRDTIRRYLSQSFYKDHLSTYKKRSIYWLFSSGKQKAFQCLVYLHRYHAGTLARMRTEYVIPLQGKLTQRMEQVGGNNGEGGDIATASSTAHRKKLQKEWDTLKKQRSELTAFDEKLRHYADQRIALDLDDGVKVNYGKFGDLLAEVKAVTGGTEE